MGRSQIGRLPVGAALIFDYEVDNPSQQQGVTMMIYNPETKELYDGPCVLHGGYTQGNSWNKKHILSSFGKSFGFFSYFIYISQAKQIIN